MKYKTKVRTPRKITLAELKELAWYIAENEMGGVYSNDNYDQTKDLLKKSYIAVFDHYMSDSPGYSGKVIVVVFSGSPEINSVYGYRNNEIFEFERDK